MLLITRDAAPDAPYRPGRRVLATVDAAAWPAAWVALIQAVPQSTGAVGALLTACAAWAGLRRLHRALWLNHRYRFTTWRWARVLAAALTVGVALRLSM